MIYIDPLLSSFLSTVSLLGCLFVFDFGLLCKVSAPAGEPLDSCKVIGYFCDYDNGTSRCLSVPRHHDESHVSHLKLNESLITPITRDQSQLANYPLTPDIL